MNKRNILQKCLAFILSTALIGAGCTYFIDEQREADSMAEAIVSALENNDRKALRALFSPYALTEADDLDQGMDYIFSLYEGEHLSLVYYGGSNSKHLGTGSRLQITRPHYVIETTQGKYHFCLIIHIVNEEQPNREGLSALAIYRDGEESDGFFYAPGIYYPGRSESHKRDGDW